MRSRGGATTTVRNNGFRNQRLPQTRTRAMKVGGFRCGASPSGVATTVRNQGFRNQKAAQKLHGKRGRDQHAARSPSEATTTVRNKRFKCCPKPTQEQEKVVGAMRGAELERSDDDGVE